MRYNKRADTLLNIGSLKFVNLFAYEVTLRPVAKR